MNSAKGRSVGNRNRPAGGKTISTANRRRLGRRVAVANRRNRRQGLRRNRNRLARAQNNLRTNRGAPNVDLEDLIILIVEEISVLKLYMLEASHLMSIIEDYTVFLEKKEELLVAKLYLIEWEFLKDTDLLNSQTQELLGELYKNGIILL